MDNESICNQISTLVLEHYKSIPLNCKPNQNEFIVLASIVCRNAKGDLSILSFCTGTKCIGQELASSNNDGCLLCDSHAEVLAKRAFNRYILKESYKLISSKQNCDNSLLELIDKSTNSEFSSILRKKENWDLYLFISDNPCGDSSIYLRNNGNVLFTGAKKIVSNIDNKINHNIIREDIQLIGCLRTKSGRSTIDQSNRTTSMSCSDKICRWITLGLQGSLIGNIIEPIYLKGIIVGKDPLADLSNQLEAIQRSLIKRLPKFINSCQIPIIMVTSLNDCNDTKCNKEYNFISKEIDKKLYGCSLSINWIKNTYLNNHNEKEKINNKIIDKIDILESTNKKLKHIQYGTLEITIATTGLLQGSTKRTLNDKIINISSRLSKKSLSHLFYLNIQQLSIYSYDWNNYISSYILTHNEKNLSCHTSLINETSDVSKTNNEKNLSCLTTSSDDKSENNEKNLSCYTSSINETSDVCKINNEKNLSCLPISSNDKSEIYNNQTYYFWKILNKNYQKQRELFLNDYNFQEWLCDNRILLESFIIK